MQRVKCQVHSITALTEHVFNVLLKPEQAIRFKAGQYLNFIMEEDDKRAFSIASSPTESLVELQIGAFAADGYAMQVIERIKQSSEVEVEIPLGNAYLHEQSDKPLLLLAGGTGFSYIKSMFDYLASQQSTRQIKVYWGVRDETALYELERTQATLAQLSNAEFYPVIQQAAENWQGKTGLVHQVVMQDIENLADYDIYMAGRFDMMKLVRDDFEAKGVSREQMHADAFAFI